MSTTPGRDSWVDSGLVPPDDAGLPTDGDDLVDELTDEVPVELPDEAGEADALEQHLGPDGLPPEPVRPSDDAAEHDLIEQAQDVPLDDEEYPTE